MLVELSKQAEFAIKIAQKLGANDAFSTATQSRDVEFIYRDGKLEKVKDATSLGMSIRLFVNGRYSTHSTTDMRAEQVADFIREAIALTKALEVDKYREITPSELFSGRSKLDLQLVDTDLKNLKRDQRLAWCEELDELTHSDKRLISATSAVYDGVSFSASASTNGFSGGMESTYVWLGSELTFKDRGDRRASSYFYAGTANREDLPSPGTISENALSRVRARLGATKGPSIKTTMVVDPSVADSLINKLLSPANASSIQQGRSFWSDYIDSKPFNEKLTIIDNPLLPRRMGSRLYDDEGISSKPLTLIENGVVKNIYVDTYYGRKLDMAPTTGTSSNRIIKPGKRSLNELIADTEKGIYVTSWMGGNTDNTTGEFSLGLRGHLIENGKIGKPVDEMNVTGDLETLFNNLREVGNDPWPYSFAKTFCPTLVFENVDFSGV